MTPVPSTGAPGCARCTPPAAMRSGVSGSHPIGEIEYPSRKVTLAPDAVRRGTRTLALHDALDPHCALVQFYPGMSPDLLKAYEGYHGLVIAGTGLGHTSTALIPQLKHLADSGTLIVMTSQCMHGRVCDRVYDTGRDLLNAGVIEGGDMLPEVALVKLMWVLGNEKDRKKAAATDAGPISKANATGGAPMDYKALGLVAGIEIHQQLDTKEKLFCHCPTTLREIAEHNGEFSRYLRATESEMGEIDRAAKEEMKHDRKFRYYTYDTTCLVENDEEPPAPLNDEALAVCLTIGKMFGMTPIPQVHMMRKLVIDGSNTSGFQRTALSRSTGHSRTAGRSRRSVLRKRQPSG